MMAFPADIPQEDNGKSVVLGTFRRLWSPAFVVTSHLPRVNLILSLLTAL